jgi:glycosyltransferase involved in cell wall biosynthesis
MVQFTILNYFHSYREKYFTYDKTRMVLYAGASVSPEYPYRRIPPLPLPPDRPCSQASVIVTATDQASSLKAWLESLNRQTRLPDEVVIATSELTRDASEDIRAFSNNASFPVRLVDAIGKSNAEAINLAVQNASFPLIVSTTLDCTPEVDWLENILFPLEDDLDVQLSAGFLQARAGSDFQRLCAHILLPHADYLHFPSFVPPWQTLALRKDLWSRTDGYPEWPGDVPGDALFCYQARQSKGQWAVVPGVKVNIDMPENLAGLHRWRYQDGLADGITGIDADRYLNKTLKLAVVGFLAGLAILAGVFSPVIFGTRGWSVFAVLLAFLASAVLLVGLSFRRSHNLGYWQSMQFLAIHLVAGLARISGYASGVGLRPAAQKRQVERFQNQLEEILARHPDRRGIIIYPPTHDWGYMFQLPQQMARQFAHKGYLYFYGTINERTDDVTGFRQVEPNLYLWHVPFETFRLLEPGPGKQSGPAPEKPILYIGSPWNRKYLAFFTDPAIIYDHYDDLVVSSGRLEDHQHLLQTADVVLVTSQRLLDDVKSVRPDVVFAPNGVDFARFQELRPAPGEAAPVDLQPILDRGKPVIGYTGAFIERVDYDLCLHLIRSRPEYEFVMIGAILDKSLDRSGLLKLGLDNVSWLGLKSYDELIKYIWCFDVGIVPFKINKITLATTSIKIFEYMACQVPVVSVAMPESKRYSGVFIAETYDQFAELLDTALRSKTDPLYQETIDRVARANTWENRVDRTLSIIEKIYTVEEAGVRDEQLTA